MRGNKWISGRKVSTLKAQNDYLIRDFVVVECENKE